MHIKIHHVRNTLQCEREHWRKIVDVKLIYTYGKYFDWKYENYIHDIYN